MFNFQLMVTVVWDVMTTYSEPTFQKHLPLSNGGVYVVAFQYTVIVIVTAKITPHKCKSL